MKVDLTWFNAGFGRFKVLGKNCKLFNCFNRVNADDEGDHWWGIGIGQIGHRHLFYVGHSGISIFWFGTTL
jgi:hypothetical protein